MKMKIGTDLDECLAEFVSGFLDYHNNKYGTKLNRKEFKSYNLWETIGGTREDAIKHVSEFYRTNYFKNLPVVFGSVNVVDLLSRENEIFVISSRPIYIHNETIKWLDDHFHEKFSEIFFSDEWNFSSWNFFNFRRKNKSGICKKLKLDFYIEDNLGYALSCARKVDKVLLLDKPWNQNSELPNNVHRVYGWNEILEKIENGV